jgi:tRNA1(Val) A37 N6-methylase TrmN6
LIAFEKLDNQNVVELGAGCGLAGIVALKYCNLRSLISTDFDPNVLNQLAENFRFNFEESDKRARVEYCDWNDQESVRGMKANPDLVIASG